MSWRNLLNLLLHQVAWFALVLGAARGLFWLGLSVLALVLCLHLGLARGRGGELRLLVAAAALGFIFDSVFIAAGAFLPVPYLLPPPWSPPWMVALWLNFAATLNCSLAWLKGRYLAAALFGGVGGPLAYYGGARLGATLALPGWGALVALGLGWALMTPFLVWLSSRLSRQRAAS